MWNEVSRRYVDAQPTMLEPIKWRSRADNVKQGSSDKEHRDNEHWQIVTQSMNWRTKMLYRHMIKEGVCPEQARMILPQSMYTEWIWSGNLYAFCNMIKLRTDPHTQLETKEIARMIASVIEPHFPISFKELVN
jgi:thymidylate synthase (FAD)